ncbi:hypothetical protein [Streptomyces sp. AC602_WCS936]|uniref:hypothetical protein n=1 Tax=Streptomyces sp. AC602_WCS936 TaxID=2823685 RepID=UPI0020B6ADBE|nr:hypothetical protein [Streptomyces sp. AC602_WCS936]
MATLLSDAGGPGAGSGEERSSSSWTGGVVLTVIGFVVLKATHMPVLGFRIGPGTGDGGEAGQEKAVAIGPFGHQPVCERTSLKPCEQAGELGGRHEPAVDAVPLLRLATGDVPSSAVVVVHGLFVKDDPLPAVAVGADAQFVEVGQVVRTADPFVDALVVGQVGDRWCQRVCGVGGWEGGVVGFVWTVVVVGVGEGVSGRRKGGVDVEQRQSCRSRVFGGVVLGLPVGVPVVRQAFHELVEGHPLVLLADPFALV